MTDPTHHRTIIRELHAALYPEHYRPPDELAADGIPLDEDGVYQWDADTLDEVADVFKRHADELADVIEKG